MRSVSRPDILVLVRNLDAMLYIATAAATSTSKSCTSSTPPAPTRGLSSAVNAEKIASGTLISFVDASTNASVAAWSEVSGLGADGDGKDFDTSRMIMS